MLEKEHTEEQLTEAVGKIAEIIEKANGQVTILTDIKPRPGKTLIEIMKTHLFLK